MTYVKRIFGYPALAVLVVLAYEKGSALMLSCRTDKRRTILQRSGEEYFKSYSRDSLFGRRLIYENLDNERVRQSVAHHWWFSWLTANR